MNPTSILIVTIEFPPLPGGIGNHAFNLAKQFASLNYKVTVLTEYRANNSTEWNNFVNTISGVDVIGIKRNKFILLTYLRRIMAYKKLSKQFHTVFFSGRFSIWLAALRFSPHTSIGIIHGSELKLTGLWRWIFQKGLNNMQHIVSVSKYTEKQLLLSYKVDKTKCVVINNGFSAITQVDVKHKSIPETGPIFITVGSMHQRKGQHNFIHALPELLKIYPNLKYIIAGLPSELNLLQNKVEILGVKHAVDFVVTPSNEEVVLLLQKAHVFVMLSEHLPNGDLEGFGIAILEAMQAKLPALGSLNSGIEDAISNNHSGILVDAHSTTDIVNAVQTILNNYEDYSENASLWSKRFEWNKVITNYTALLQ